MATATCALSPLGLVQSIEADTIAFPPVAKSSWGNGQAYLSVVPDDPTDASFLNGLRRDTGKIVVAYQHDIAICTIKEVVHHTEKGESRWDLTFREEVSEFTPSIEVGFSGTSADELAEIRARRLLLNENPAKDTKDMNAILREVLVGGQDTFIRVERSPFPILYKRYGPEPQRFTEIAWILAAMQLRLSAIVEQIDRLELTLRGQMLDVNFAGRRRKRYVNAPAPVIHLSGTCAL
jgi:hypothetical protein